MKVLGLDTSTLTASVALVDDASGTPRVIASAVRAPQSAAPARGGAGRTADVLVAIDETCRTAGIAPGEIEAVAVGAGPGSFTGLRIGMATAKGIAFAARHPLWAVSSLAALAHHVSDPAASLVVAVLDARRGELFAGCYRDGVLVGDERVLAPDELVPWVDELAAGTRPTFVGDAIGIHDALAPLAPAWQIATPSGSAVAALALAGARVDVVVGGAPTYLRKAEAEIKYPDGVPGALRRR